MSTINYKEVDIKKGVYLDFENGPVFLMQMTYNNIMLCSADGSYRGEYDSLEEILKRHDNVKYAKTLKGEQITL